MLGANDLRGKLPLRAGSTYQDAYPTRDLSMVKWLAVHHTGMGAARPTVHDVAAFQTSATAQAPFPGFAYVGFVDPDGTIAVCWDVERVPWSNGDNSPSAIGGVGLYNWWTVAFCFSGQDPTDAQFQAYVRIKHALAQVLGRSIEVKSHREICGANDTECPGDVMESKMDALRSA